MNKPAVILLNPSSLSDDQKACVEVLRQAYELALEGKISSIGVVACMKGGYAAVMGGTGAADLNLGLDDLKDQILSGVREAARRRSGIIGGR